jgi:hypothetical protein
MMRLMIARGVLPGCLSSKAFDTVYWVLVQWSLPYMVGVMRLCFERS